MKIIHATNMRNSFQEVVDRVYYTKESALILKHRKPWVVIKPFAEEEFSNPSKKELAKFLDEAAKTKPKKK